MAGDGFDVVVIGAGVVGLAIAARLAADDRRSVLVLEREEGVARGVTSRNSEVIHAGIYYPADSLKAATCVEGRERLYAWCAEHRVDHRRLGKWIVASEEREIATLEDLLERGRVNGVARLDLVDAREIARREPNVRAVAALDSPDTGIVDAHGFCLSLLAHAESAGAMLATARRVEAIEPTSAGHRIDARAPDGELESIETGIVVDAAGLAADDVASRAGLDVDALGWRQHPCKGDYFAFGPGEANDARRPERLVYPVPQQAGLGIHATLDLAGRVRFGPDAEYLPPGSTEPFDYDVDPRKAEAFRDAAARYLPAMADAVLTPDYAGMRPKLAAPGEGFRDFVVEECTAHGVPGFVACVGIESPGLTAALALAERVASLVR